jgi:hypothetical protein
MFDLRRPCITCPFRKGVGETFMLPPARLKEIKYGIGFQCHKTLDYTHWGNRRKRAGKNPQQCVGLMAVLQREGPRHTHAMMQLAERFGMDLSGLDPHHEAYDSWADVLKAHAQP